MLNNTGDTVRLLNADLQEKDSFEYIQCNDRTPSVEPINVQLANSVSPTQKPSKPLAQKSTQKHISKKTHAPSIKSRLAAPSPEVLGVASIAVTGKTKSAPNHILLFVPFSYSFLTIASLFIKMNHA
jgi:hypothetical protein